MTEAETLRMGRLSCHLGIELIECAFLALCGYKRTAGIPRLDGHTDLEMARIVLNPGETGDFSFGHAGFDGRPCAATTHCFCVC